MKDVLWRTYGEVSNDRVSLIAAGVTYYLLLALFPALAALVSIYGLVADPATLGKQMQALSGLLPPGATGLVQDQLSALTSQRGSTLSLTFAASLLFALWSANNGMKAVFQAMNIAYDEEEKRGFFALNLQSLALTLLGIVTAGLLVFAVGVVPAILAFMHLGSWAEGLASLLRWPLLLALVWAAIAILYRFGPSREDARLRWISWGAGLSAISWMVMSFGFSYYLSHFGNYNATYGALGALVGLIVWMWLSVTILIVGAELDAELEHQTAKDTTTGKPRPIGSRHAEMADTVGKSAK